MRTTTAPATAPSVLLTDATVHAVERLSPAFVRVHLASPAFVDLGEEGADTRFKLVLPGPSGELPPQPDRAEDWYAEWLATPVEVRPAIRTYTVRDVVRDGVCDGGGVRLVVDLVVHDSSPGHEQGPACRWALAVRPGDVVRVVAPHRLSSYGATEFAPGVRRRLLLAGDETAVPAVARILADLGPGYAGEVFLEVPTAADVLDLPVSPDVRVTWLARGDTAYNRGLVQEVRRHLGLSAVVQVQEAGEDVWETPRHSATGEDLRAGPSGRPPAHELAGTYAWIAGESWMVKALRRSLVTELGLDRSQVAFMGYWREGVGMR